MTFDEIPEFGKDLKNLLKKYATLLDDLEVVKKVLTVYPDERPPLVFALIILDWKPALLRSKK